MSKVSALRRSIEVVEYREGGDTSTGCKSPGLFEDATRRVGAAVGQFDRDKLKDAPD